MVKEKKTISKRTSKQDVINQLIANNIALQQKMINLMGSMHNLSNRMDKLVNIFQKAAESLEKGEAKEPLHAKLGELLEQNKKLAQGLILLEDYVKKRGTISPLNLGKNEF